MSYSRLQFRDEARAKVLAGASELADAVRVTLGPRSKSVLIENNLRTGVRILRQALEVPARQIAANSGVDGGVVIEHLRAGQGSFGFDAARACYVDLDSVGIIDPTKVTRVALENAVSIAGVLLLTEATLTEIEEPARQPAAAPEM
jgi:chaperonin GroEL